MSQNGRATCNTQGQHELRIIAIIMAFIKEGTHQNKAILHEALYNNNNINYRAFTTIQKVSYMFHAYIKQQLELESLFKSNN